MQRTWGGASASATPFCAQHSGDACNCAMASTGTEQSLEELEFSRSACAAAQAGDTARLRRILQRNAQAVHGDAGTTGGYSPLHYAARAGHVEAVNLLLQSGANPNAQTRGMGATPLHRAALQGHEGVVSILLRAGADAAVADCDGETALHKAAAQGHGRVCQALLAACPAAAAAQDKAGRTPAQRARGAATTVLGIAAGDTPTT